MPAYVIVEIDVTDPAAYEEYKSACPATIEQFGGRYLARGGRAENLEGDWQPKRVVVLEFPSLDRAKAWWSSAEYRPVKAIRDRTARSRMIVVEGL
jgi:uncharacterized protein (DUF1330 family)